MFTDLYHIEEFGELGAIIITIYVIYLLIKTFQNKTEKHSFSFIVLLIYNLILLLITFDSYYSIKWMFNIFWFIPFLISIIYEVYFYNKNRINVNTIDDKENHSKAKIDQKRFIALLTVLVILMNFLPAYFERAWYNGGEELLQYIQSKFYSSTKNYLKEADALLNMSPKDNEEINRVYNEGSEYYYNNGQYRECIEFQKNIRERLSHYSGYYVTRTNEKDYEMLSYKKIFDKYVSENDIVKLFELKNELANYENLIEYDIDFDLYLNKFISFKFLKKNQHIEFGKIGITEAGFDYNKKELTWSYLFRNGVKLYLISDIALCSRPMNDGKNINMKYEDTDIYSFLNDYLYDAMFDDEEKQGMVQFEDGSCVSLLSEEMIDTITNNNDIEYLSSLLKNLSNTAMIDKHNRSIDKQLLIKTNIVNGECKVAFAKSYNNEIYIENKKANTYNNVVVPIICIDLDKMTTIGYTILENKELERIEQDRIKKDKSLTFDLELKNKISVMKKVSEYDDTATIEEFDTIVYGKDGKNKLCWILLDKTDDKALLLNKYILFSNEYNYSVDNVEEAVKKNWSDSNCRKMVDDDDFFSDDERRHICNIDNIISKNDKYNQYDNLDTVEDDLFLLSIDDIKKYFYNNDEEKINNNFYKSKLSTVSMSITNDYERMAYWLRDIGELWWTVATIEEDGTLNQRGRVASNSYGVRPAMWINY